MDNQRFITKMLDERGMQDCNPAKNPLTKKTLDSLHANKDKPLTADAATDFRSGLGQIR